MGLALLSGVALVVMIALGLNGLGGTLDAPGGIGVERSGTPGGIDASDDVVGIGPETPRADTDDAEPDRSPSVDPGPLRCAPDGCDAWQSPAPDGDLAGSADVLYALDGARLSALSGLRGTERWSLNLGDPVAVTGDGDPIADPGGADEPPIVLADPGGVVVVTQRAIVRHDRQGEQQWQHPSGGWHVWDAMAVDGRHLITRSRSAGGNVPFGRVAVLDLDDGSERWTRQVTQVHGVTDELLLAGGLRGEIGAFDLDDGSPLWQLPDSQTAVRVVGPVVHLEPMSADARPGARLVDASTGTTPAHLVGTVLHAPVLLGERVVTVLHDVDSGSAARVVALEADGTVAWVHDLAVDTDSGANDAITTAALYDLADGSVLDVVVGTEGGPARSSLRLRDGAMLAPGASIPPDASDEAAVDGLAATSEPDGDQPGWRTVPGGIAVREDGDALLVRGTDGTVVSVRGPAPTLVATDPVVVRGGDRLLGLRVGVPG